jgi:DHA2 family multidrug resistance protein
MTSDVALKSGYKMLDYHSFQASAGNVIYGCVPVPGRDVPDMCPFVLWTRSGKTKVDASAVH